MIPIRKWLRKLKDFVIYRILHVDDTPHRIALGVAIGMFVTWTPTPGFQMALTFALSYLLGANKVVGLPMAWVSNPFTFVPINGPNYWLGCRMIGAPVGDLHAFREAMEFHGGFITCLNTWWAAIRGVLWPLFLGSLVIGGAVALVSYLLTYYGVVQFRKHRHRHAAADVHGDAGQAPPPTP
jgi:hypothetical protein